MPQFGTLEWIQTLRTRLNESERFRRAARGWNASLLYEVLPEPGSGLDEPAVLGLTVVKGEVTDAWEGERASDYRITAPYGVFRAMNNGEMNAIKAVTARKLKMRGNPARLLRDARPVNALQAVAVDMSKDGTTEWVGTE